MDPRIARLIDEAEITRLIHLYCRSMDRCDREIGHAMFHPGGTVDYGPIFAGDGRAFIDHVCAAHLGMENHQHRVFNVLIDVDGDSAGSETYVDARFRGEQNGQRVERSTRGRYLDRWERREGRWGMVHRRYVHETDECRPVDCGRFPPEGRRDREDESYALLAPPPPAPA